VDIDSIPFFVDIAARTVALRRRAR